METLGKLKIDTLCSFYSGKRIIVTGHTGFKGSWLCKILSMWGADVTGFSLPPPTNPDLYDIANIKLNIHSSIGDIRNKDLLLKTFKETKPEIVFHLAAQPIVRESYISPSYTYETNVMGTVNVLDCVRMSNCVKSVVNITTDKVYHNHEWSWGYRENDELGGFDPYSNSKSCSELVTNCYRNSFFTNKTGQILIPVSTVRAGNVIGGGDFAKDRIIPDCVRACLNNEDILVRNPYSTRPYQHVLESLSAYLLVAADQYVNPILSGSYNIGPNENSCVQTGELVSNFVYHWGEGIKQRTIENKGPHEANFLKLDNSRIKTNLGWYPYWNIDKAVEEVVEWTKCWIQKGNINQIMEKQINEYFLRKEAKQIQ